jgi:Virulence factor
VTSYQVMSWRGIPTEVKVSADDGTVVRRQLPAFFQQEVDRVAMAEGLIDGDAYLDAWHWSEPEQREGTPEAVADAIVDELAVAWRKAQRTTG